MSTVALINHSSLAPNHDSEDGTLKGAWLATKDINIGDEFLCDYTVFGEEPEWF